MKYILVTMPDRSVWKVPADIVAKNRADYFASGDAGSGLNYQEVYEAEYQEALQHNYELLDWAENNMNWTDVVSSAIKVPTPPQILTPLEWQEGWVNGPKQIIEEVSDA